MKLSDYITISKQANKKGLLIIFILFIIIGMNGFLIENYVNDNYDLISYLEFINISILIFLPIYFFKYVAIKLPNPKDVDDVKLLKNTKDIRVRCYINKGFIDRNNQISFVRFFFDIDKIYMYFTNFLKIYNGPFIIMEKDKSNLDMYYVDSFKELEYGEIEIMINSKMQLNQSFKLELRNISDEDYKLIKKYLLISSSKSPSHDQE